MTRERLLATLLLAVPALPGCIVRLSDSDLDGLHWREHEHAHRRVVSTPLAPQPVGPYSQAIVVGDTVYAAGQIGMDPASGNLVEGGIGAQTRQALTNLRAVLETAGFSLRDVVQAQVFLADLGDYAAMNAVYSEFFPERAPARAAFGVAALPKGARVEILVVAVRG